MKKRKAIDGMFCLAIPIVVAILVLFTSNLQNKFATDNAISLGEALDNYRNEKGKYPATLADLTPDYISKISRAGIALLSQEFKYDRREDQAVCEVTI